MAAVRGHHSTLVVFCLALLLANRLKGRLGRWSTSPPGKGELSVLRRESYVQFKSGSPRCPSKVRSLGLRRRSHLVRSANVSSDACIACHVRRSRRHRRRSHLPLRAVSIRGRGVPLARRAPNGRGHPLLDPRRMFTGTFLDHYPRLLFIADRFEEGLRQRLSRAPNTTWGAVQTWRIVLFKISVHIVWALYTGGARLRPGPLTSAAGATARRTASCAWRRMAASSRASTYA